MVVNNHGLQGHKRLQYATVWNNGVPTLYFEANKENVTLFGDGCMIINMSIHIIYTNLMMFM